VAYPQEQTTPLHIHASKDLQPSHKNSAVVVEKAAGKSDVRVTNLE
jgi:hypothetical protein